MASIEGGIIDWSQGSLNPSSIYKIPNFGDGGSYWKTSEFVSSDHCAPTAATNILWYWGWHASTNTKNIVRNKISSSGTNLQKAQRIFQIVFTGMGTNVGSSGTPYANIPSGYTYYLGVKPGNGWNYRELTGFTNIYNTITEQCPIDMYVSVTGAAHELFVLGRATSVLYH